MAARLAYIPKSPKNDNQNITEGRLPDGSPTFRIKVRWTHEFNKDLAGRVFEKDTNRRTKKEAVKARNEFYDAFNSIESGEAYSKSIVVRNDSLTVKQFNDQLVSSGLWQNKDNTKNIRQRIQLFKDYVLPEIGAIELDAVNPTHIEATLRTFTDTKIKKRRSAKEEELVFPGQSSVQALKVAMSQFFSEAVKARKIMTNPAREVNLKSIKVKGKKKKDAKTQVLDEDQRKALLKACEGSVIYPVIMVMDAIGCRPGEAQALTREDFDTENHTVRIHKSMNERSQIKSTKTNEERTVQIPPALSSFIESLKREPEEPIGLDTSRKTEDRAQMFIGYREFYTLAREKIDKAKLGKEVTMYWLRHSFCTRSLNEHHIPPAIVAGIAGHSIQVLLSTYSHDDPKIARDYMDKVQVLGLS